MSGYLIKDTTREEREQIVAESLGNIEATCDGCMSGLAEMYQDYIDGKKELREINMEFNARYVKGEDATAEPMPDVRKKIYMRQGTLFRTKTTSPRPVQRCAGFFLTRKNQSDMILISK